jgi:diaminohydroxyphosphoribosylaminopyrimidine deaminase/5-amino-6-(5-phosphoribosylamino)uracil reductase
MALSDSDRLFLNATLELAARGLYSAPPNPKVGCLLVRDGIVLGRGWHQVTGGPHAEIEALSDAGGIDQIAGATCYVSLEPCAHQGRTPPCAEALIEGKVARVVAAGTDPNPQVSGSGFELLRAAGIAVDVVELPAARELNRGYLKQMEHNLPWVRLKVAGSLDGRTAMASGESQWITSEAARADGQHFRALSSAVVTGIGTVLADDPALTVRITENARQPLRVVLDSALRTPENARILKAPGHALLVTTRAVDPDTVATEVLALEGQRVPLDGLLAALAVRDCNEVLVEAGPELTGAFLAAGLWDELILYQAPKLLGASARGLAGFQIDALADAVEGHIVETRRFGEDLRIRMLRVV